MEDLYSAPSSEVRSQAPVSRSNRLRNCLVAWLIGSLSMPALYAAVSAAMFGATGPSVFRTLTVQGILMYAAVGLISVLAVVPFRTLRLWLAMLAGILPVVLIVIIAIAVAAYRITA